MDDEPILDGQPILKRILGTHIRASIAANAPIPHCLFSGPPGTGKTLVSQHMAKMRGVNFIRQMGPTFNDVSLAAMLIRNKNRLSPAGFSRTADRFHPNGGRTSPTVLCIDECEEVPKKVLERMFPLLEPGDPSKRIIKVKYEGIDWTVWVPPFTLVLITNFPADIKTPAVVSRCAIRHMFTPYTDDGIAAIVIRHVMSRSHRISVGAVEHIVRRAMGIPRTAIQLTDTAMSMWDEEHGGDQVMTAAFVDDALTAMGIDAGGIGPMERSYLECLKVHNRASEQMMSILMGEDVKTIRRTIEPGLIRAGLIAIVPGGRMLTPKGRSVANAGASPDADLDPVL